MSKIFFSPEQCEHTDLKIFSFGSGMLSNEIVSHLDISLGKHETLRFSDGEINMRLLDSVSGHKVFIIKTFEDQKINDGLMELMLAVSCMKKAGATAVVAIIPYFPYSRMHSTRLTDSAQDDGSTKTFFAADIAKMIESCGCDMIITMNAQLHEMKGFTNRCTFINLDCSDLIVPYLIHKEISHPVIVGTSLNPFHSFHVQSLKDTFRYFDL
jgi:phosphoribosylpyrophosphate synthetase